MRSVTSLGRFTGVDAVADACYNASNDHLRNAIRGDLEDCTNAHDGRTDEDRLLAAVPTLC